MRGDPGAARPRRPRKERAAEAPGGLRLSHVVAISLELHALAIMLLAASGLLVAKVPPRDRRVDIVSIKDLELPAPKLPPLAQPKAAPPEEEAPRPSSGPEPPKTAADPSALDANLEEAGDSFTGMSVPTGGAAAPGGKSGGGGKGGGAGDDLGDFAPQYAISDMPIVPAEEVRSRVRYPVLAARQGIEATVYLELFIDKTGRVVRVNVLKDPGFGFAEAARTGLLDLVCAPAKIGGKPAAVRYRYPVSFKLK